MVTTRNRCKSPSCRNNLPKAKRLDGAQHHDLPLRDALAAEQVLTGKKQRSFHSLVADGAVWRSGVGNFFCGSELPSILSSDGVVLS